VKKTAGTRSKEQAGKVKRALEAEFRGEAPAPDDDLKSAVLVSSAINSFTESKKKRKQSTKDNYASVFKHLSAFCQAPTKVNADGDIVPLPPINTLPRFTNEMYEHFAATWDNIWESRLSQMNVRISLGAFFKYCLRKRWITHEPFITPIDDVNHAPSFPLTQDEVTSLFATIPSVFPLGDKSIGHGAPFSRTEERSRIENFLTFQLGTGLAIVDAVGLPKSALQFNAELNCYELTTKRMKTGESVHGSIDNDVVEKAFSTPNKNPDYMFWDGKVSQKGATRWFANRIRRLFAAAGIEDVCHTKSHRIRDTFVVRLLAKGASMEKVAAAIGDTIAVTERVYAKWVPERQQEQFRAIAETLKKPLPIDQTAAELELLARLKAKYGG
jgi:site-specific recombinase XerD